MYQWLLFDVDNTLFDFNLAEQKSLEATFLANQLPFAPEFLPIYKSINKRLWQAFEQGKMSANEINTVRFAQLLDQVGFSADAHQFSQIYASQLARCTDLLHGAQELLDTLASNYQMGLVTNGLKEIQRPRLRRSPLLSYFNPIIISGEVGVQKPDAGIFDLAFAGMNKPDKSTVLMIGDSLSSDMQGGINYGMDTCWFNPENRPNQHDLPITYEIHHLADLLNILETNEMQQVKK